jgi:hypothetical protein
LGELQKIVTGLRNTEDVDVDELVTDVARAKEPIDYCGGKIKRADVAIKAIVGELQAGEPAGRGERAGRPPVTDGPPGVGGAPGVKAIAFHRTVPFAKRRPTTRRDPTGLCAHAGRFRPDLYRPAVRLVRNWPGDVDSDAVPARPYAVVPAAGGGGHDDDDRLAG